MSKARRQKPNKASSKAKATNSIRLIAGKHRGRKLPVLDAEGLRPTTDRVKETLFNWLMVYIQDSKCLDCFAGAGSLGFEAFSRGAEQVTMLELNKAAANQLNENKAQLNANNINVEHTDTTQYLSQPNTCFDIVFVDPPFRQNLAQQTINLLANGWLNAGALVYVETEAELAAPTTPENWQIIKEKKAGQVACRLYQLT